VKTSLFDLYKVGEDKNALFDQIAEGGMATVHLGRLIGPVGFSKIVAIKQMHESAARNPDFVAMFLDEARLSGRVQHPNVVATYDVIAKGGEAFLVMEYVHGESLAALLRAARKREQRPKYTASYSPYLRPRA